MYHFSCVNFAVQDHTADNESVDLDLKYLLLCQIFLQKQAEVALYASFVHTDVLFIQHNKR